MQSAAAPLGACDVLLMLLAIAVCYKCSSLQWPGHFQMCATCGGMLLWLSLTRFDLAGMLKQCVPDETARSEVLEAAHFRVQRCYS